MIRRPPRSTLSSSSAASDVYKRQVRQEAAADAGGHLDRVEPQQPLSPSAPDPPPAAVDSPRSPGHHPPYQSRQTRTRMPRHQAEWSLLSGRGWLSRQEQQERPGSEIIGGRESISGAAARLLRGSVPSVLQAVSSDILGTHPSPREGDIREGHFWHYCRGLSTSSATGTFATGTQLHPMLRRGLTLSSTACPSSSTRPARGIAALKGGVTGTRQCWPGAALLLRGGPQFTLLPGGQAQR